MLKRDSFEQKGTIISPESSICRKRKELPETRRRRLYAALCGTIVTRGIMVWVWPRSGAVRDPAALIFVDNRWITRERAEMSTCIQCGREFDGRSDARYCSGACRALAGRSARPDREQAHAQAHAHAAQAHAQAHAHQPPPKFEVIEGQKAYGRPAVRFACDRPKWSDREPWVPRGC